jgi:hypothetical protein
MSEGLSMRVSALKGYLCNLFSRRFGIDVGTVSLAVWHRVSW